MPIVNGTILDGATISATGGTSKTLSLDGTLVSNGVRVSDFSVTDARVRPSVSAKNRPASYDRNTGVWKKRKSECVLTFPKVLASGVIEYPNVRIIVEDHPEMSAAETTKMALWSAQVIFNASFADFIAKGVTA